MQHTVAWYGAHIPGIKVSVCYIVYTVYDTVQHTVAWYGAHIPGIKVTAYHNVL